MLDKWLVATREEEQVILQQFLRFGETKSIAQEIILQDTRETREKSALAIAKSDSEIKKFIERSNLTMQQYLRSLDPRQLLTQQMVTYASAATVAAAAAATPVPHITIAPTTPTTFVSQATTGHEAINMSLQASSTPSSRSPLSRLQTMQPFDYRREHTSPALSPSSSEKSQPTSTASSKSPEVVSIPSSPPHTIPVSTPAAIPLILTPKHDEEAKFPSAVAVDDSANGAIDYSLKDSSPSSDSECSATNNSLFADQKVKHLRKSANPMKRAWQPNPAFGATLVSPSGKKRVLCTACNKTFCDKGALKIHYSAVHLKEMHKCTVEGCNMMFSSRRSRNRHSANPNPKLHMPNAKLPRKAEDEMGCPQENTPPKHNSPPAMITTPFGMTLPLVTPDGKRVLPKIEPDRAVLAEHGFYMDPNGQLGLLLSTPPKVPRMDVMKPQLPLLPQPTPTGPTPMTSQLMINGLLDNQTTRSSSRRKSIIPTRCAQPEDLCHLSDENSMDESGALSISEEDMMPQDLSLKPQDMGAGEDGLEERGTSPVAMSESMDTEAGCESQPQPIVVVPEAVVDEDVEDDLDGEDEDLVGDGEDSEDGEVFPVDKENPRRCTVCGKVFPNVLATRAHFESIHAKQMYTCSVAGCNAAFPSKRSRDRHSGNLNLHRKLLSTTAATPTPPPVTLAESPSTQTQEFLPRIYETGQYVSNTNNLSPVKGEDAESHAPACHTPSSPTHTASQGDISTAELTATDTVTESTNLSDAENGMDEETEMKDADGLVSCHVCKQRFRDNLVLKEHFEKVHPREVYHCTISGCDKIFSTRKSRNRHSQNDNLHRHLNLAKMGIVPWYPNIPLYPVMHPGYFFPYHFL